MFFSLKGLSDDFDALFLAQLQAEVFQLELLDFSAACHGEFPDEKDVFGNLVTGDLALTELPDIKFVHFDSFVQDDEGAYCFAVAFRGDAGHLHVPDAFHLVKELFDFAGVDVFATADDHVFDAAGDAEVTIFVLHAQVARVQEPVGINHFGGGFRILVIALHGVVAAVAHLALYAYRAFFAGFGVDDFHFGMFKFTAYGVATYVERVVDAGMGHARGRFGESVYAGHPHEHLFFHLFHQFHGTERTSHDAGAQAGEVEHIEHGVVEFSDKHGGYAVEGGTAFFVDGSQDHQRVEAFHHYLGAAVGQTVHGGQDHAEAVEEGNADAQLVVACKLHVFTGQEAVVGDVVVGEHDTFRETGSTGGVLHVDGVVTAHLFFGGQQVVVVDVAAQEQDFRRVVHAPVFFLSDIDDIFHAGESLALEVASLAGAQFGQHGIDHVDKIIVAAVAVYDAQGVHVGVLAQVFQFGLFVVGVHGDSHRSDFGTGIEEGQPVGHIACPDADVGATFHTNGQESFGHMVYAFVELLPGESQIAVRVDDVFFVGSGGSPMLQPVAEGSRK